MRKRNSSRTGAILAALALAACSESAPSPRATQGTSRITGTLLEKLDGPPYSFLRLQTEKGEVWAAVPVTGGIDTEKPVTVVNGVELKGFQARGLGRKFDAIVFGTLERPQPR